MALSAETENILLHRAVELLKEGKRAEADFLLTDTGQEATTAHDAQQQRVNEELVAFLGRDGDNPARLVCELKKLLKLHGIGKPRTKSLIDARKTR